MGSRGHFIPVNDVPNEKELLNGLFPTRVVEQTGTKESPMEPQERNASQIDYIWGFFFFDACNVSRFGHNVYFNGEVSKDSMTSIRDTILNMSSDVQAAYNTMGIYDCKAMHINLFINSPGGCMSAGFDFIDFMDNHHIPVHTIGTGTVASMGSLLLMAGAKRYVAPNAHVLLHQLRAGIQGKHADLIDYLQHIEAVHTQTIRFISKHTKLTLEKTKELLTRETWLDAQEVLNLGIVDSIGLP